MDVQVNEIDWTIDWSIEHLSGSNEMSEQIDRVRLSTWKKKMIKFQSYRQLGD